MAGVAALSSDLSAALSAAARRQRGAAAGRRPEHWLLGASLLAWSALLVMTWGGDPAGAAGGHRHAPAGSAPIAALGAHLGHWMLMVVAMMLPLVFDPVRTVWSRSFRQRRGRAVCGFVVGYLSLWAATGLAVSTVLAVASSVGPSPSTLAAVLFLLAAAWQGSRGKKRSLVACHATAPLAPRGMRADWHCVRYGLQIGSACAASCGLLMAACAATGHHLGVMLVCFWIALAERLAYRPSPRLLAAAGAGLGLAALAGLF